MSTVFRCLTHVAEGVAILLHTVWKKYKCGYLANFRGLRLGFVSMQADSVMEARGGWGARTYTEQCLYI